MRFLAVYATSVVMTILASEVIVAQETETSSRYVVTATPAPVAGGELGTPSISLDVQDTLTSEIRHLAVESATPNNFEEAVRMGLYEVEVIPIGDQRVLLKEILKLGEAVSIVNLATASVLDRITGYGFAFSEDKSRAVYTYRAPPRILVDQVALVYDFTRSPAENTMSTTGAGTTTSTSGNQAYLGASDPLLAQRGIIVYPPENQTSGRFRSASEPLVNISSPFAWCGNDRLAFLHRHGVDASDSVSLVTLTVPTNLAESRVTSEQPLDRALFLLPEYQNELPPFLERYRDITPPAQALFFDEECTSVLVTPFGGPPFVDYPVAIPLPTADQNR